MPVFCSIITCKITAILFYRLINTCKHISFNISIIQLLSRIKHTVTYIYVCVYNVYISYYLWRLIIMAFDGPKKNAFEKGKETHEKMTEALNNKPVVDVVTPQPTISSMPTRTPIQKEKVKPFTFTLKPSNRKALNKIAKRHGFSSTSAFLDEWIEANKDN